MEPRFADVDADALDQTIRRATDLLAEYPDLRDPRHYETFRLRAGARYSRGAPARGVVDDLRSAALCLDGQAGVRLYKLEPHRLKTRRLDPLHLALLHADPALVERMGGAYGLPLANFYAGTATADVEREVRLMSPYFDVRHLRSPGDAVGLAAATYAAALGSLMAGDDGSARAVLRVLSREVETLAEAPPAPARRYLLQCAALADIAEERSGELAARLAALAPWARDDRERTLASAPGLVRGEGAGAPDLAVLALVGLAMVVNLDPDLAALRAADPQLAVLADEVVAAWAEIE